VVLFEDETTGFKKMIDDVDFKNVQSNVTLKINVSVQMVVGLYWRSSRSNGLG
jgi:hypothetical protein